jgi:phage-related tail fiber protein
VLAGEGLVASDIPGVLAGVIDRAHLLTISDVNLGANPATLVNHAQPGVSIHTVSKSYIESGASASDYCDLMYFNSHNNASRGNNNALLFTKTGARGIYHYSTVWDGVTWGTPKQLAYTDSDITGNAATASTLQTARSFAFTGDAVSPAQNFNGSSNLSFALTLASTGVTAGTYRSVTVDTKGRVTSGTNPTTLAGYGITDAATITQLNTQIQALQSQIDELRSYLMMKI